MSILSESHLALCLNNFKMLLFPIIARTCLIVKWYSLKLPLIDCNTRFYVEKQILFCFERKQNWNYLYLICFDDEIFWTE